MKYKSQVTQLLDVVGGSIRKNACMHVYENNNILFWMQEIIRHSTSNVCNMYWTSAWYYNFWNILVMSAVLLWLLENTTYFFMPTLWLWTRQKGDIADCWQTVDYLFDLHDFILFKKSNLYFSIVISFRHHYTKYFVWSSHFTDTNYITAVLLNAIKNWSKIITGYRLPCYMV